jgi:hypothetical protein
MTNATLQKADNWRDLRQMAQYAQERKINLLIFNQLQHNPVVIIFFSDLRQLFF